MIPRDDMEKRIFTFWEPKEAMPAYIRLCMRTWAKVLPDYEVVLLDHGSLGEWFDFGDLRPVLDSMPLSQQSDAIGAALLVKYGGLWLDADTILLSDCVQDAFHVPANFVQFGAHCALAASRKNGLIARAWWREVERNLRFKHDCERWQDGLGCLRLRMKYLLSYARRHEHLHRWDYLANFSLSSGWSSLPVRVTKKIHSLFGIREYASLDRATARPEMAFGFGDDEAAYRRFWFEENHFDEIRRWPGAGLAMLHNSWTPDAFRMLDEDGVLAQPCTFSSVVKWILDI